MQKLIPIYYGEYGKYINRYRAIPSYIDCLKLVERRILLTLHETARNKFVKSAKVVGDCIGRYHPHGDQSVYGTLVNLVHQGLAIGKGNWGSPGLIDAEASAYRYTEVKINPKVDELAFKYINFVPWEELELDPEPIYLPSPIPIGLIGEGVITGISFYKTTIPRYKLSDLALRMLWLIEHNFKTVSLDEELSENVAGPKIKPNIDGCDLVENSTNQFYKLLVNGTGTITIIPHGKIENDRTIKILGKVPNSSFNQLIKDKEVLEIYLNDLSTDKLDIEIIPKKRNIDLNNLAAKIWDDYLIKKMNFSIIVCDNDGKVSTVGIDTLLYNSYHAWKYAILLKSIDDYNKLNEKKIELLTIQIIRYILEKYNCTKVSEVIQHFLELTKDNKILVELEQFDLESNCWKKDIREISSNCIVDVCNKRSIKNLIENQIDIQDIENELISAKSSIVNIDYNCYEYIKSLTT